MTTLMDPKVAAIMARFDPIEKKEDTLESKPAEKVKPPTNLEEFMKVEALEEWPQRLTSEGPLDIQSEALLFGTQEDIANILRESAPLGVYMLDELEARLDKLEDKLRFYASQIVTEEKREEKEEDVPYGVNRAFITELMGSETAKAHHSGKKMLRQNDPDFVESVMETRKKSLDYCQFPGFRHGELIELPGQMESPPILHRVTKAQNFNPGFKKFWKKLFLSEASVAVMQDTFWWFFLEKYDPKKQEEKDLLYDRIADSFVALFTSAHKDVKDKFLSVYPDCLAQAVYMAYWTAFPESQAKFDDKFKQDLVNCVYEWITGLKPVPGTASGWPVKHMEAKDPRKMEREGSQAVATQMMQAAALNKEVKLSLDMESFTKVMNSLGADLSAPTPSFGGLTPQNMSREVTKMTTMTNLTNLTNGLSVNSHGAPIRETLSRPSPSRLATCGTPRRQAKESHQIGPGPAYERVLFNTSGRSPLISHYLHMRSLRDFQQPGKKVRRTEIQALPAPGVTYKQLIQNRLAMSDALKREYEKICDQTHKDIMEIERKRVETNREINNITRELMMTKNPLDIKILSERIMAIRGETDPKVPKRANREKDREMSLLEKDPDHAPAGSDHHDDEDF